MKTETINVSGMTCGGCAANVTRVLQAIPGVDSVDVSLPSNAAEVTFDERRVSLDVMRAAVRGAGYDVASTPVQLTHVGGGCCGSH